MKFNDMTHDEMLERLRLCECALSAAVKERDGLRQKLAAEVLAKEYWMMLEEVARLEAAMRQREHAALLADSGSVRALAERVAEKAAERAANMAVELAAMTLSRDQARQEVDQLRRLIELVKPSLERLLCEDCPASGTRCARDVKRGVTCGESIFRWAAQQAKEGGK